MCIYAVAVARNTTDFVRKCSIHISDLHDDSAEDTDYDDDSDGDRVGSFNPNDSSEEQTITTSKVVTEVKDSNIPAQAETAIGACLGH